MTIDAGWYPRSPAARSATILGWIKLASRRYARRQNRTGRNVRNRRRFVAAARSRNCRTEFFRYDGETSVGEVQVEETASEQTNIVEDTALEPSNEETKVVETVAEQVDTAAESQVAEVAEVAEVAAAEEVSAPDSYVTF